MQMTVYCELSSDSAYQHRMIKLSYDISSRLHNTEGDITLIKAAKKEKINAPSEISGSPGVEREEAARNFLVRFHFIYVTKTKCFGLHLRNIFIELLC